VNEEALAHWWAVAPNLKKMIPGKYHKLLASISCDSLLLLVTSPVSVPILQQNTLNTQAKCLIQRCL